MGLSKVFVGCLKVHRKTWIATVLQMQVIHMNIGKVLLIGGHVVNVPREQFI